MKNVIFVLIFVILSVSTVSVIYAEEIPLVEQVAVAVVMKRDVSPAYSSSYDGNVKAFVNFSIIEENLHYAISSDLEKGIFEVWVGDIVDGEQTSVSSFCFYGREREIKNSEFQFVPYSQCGYVLISKGGERKEKKIYQKGGNDHLGGGFNVLPETEAHNFCQEQLEIIAKFYSLWNFWDLWFKRDRLL